MLQLRPGVSAAIAQNLSGLSPRTARIARAAVYR
jgi:hypothetical protein